MARDNSDWGGNAAFLLTVAAAYLAWFLSGQQSPAIPGTAALIALGILYTAIPIYGVGYFECSGSTARRLLFFAVEIALGAAIIYSTGGFGFMGFILLPMASYAVILLPRHWMIAVCVVLLIVIATLYGVLVERGAFIQAGVGYTAALVFVVVFTQAATNERNARAEIERLASELADANRKLREYAAQVEDLATTKERNRLAREIHDSLGHYLTTVNIQLEAAQVVLTRDPSRALDALRKAQALTKEGLAEVRRSVAALRGSPTGDRPLPEALGTLVQACKDAGILADLRVLGTPRALASQAELTLYRAVQEALTNVQKHSHATRVIVALDYGSAATVRLAVCDNGVGAAALDGGFGLLGLRERVQLLDGTVKTTAEPGNGFTLEVQVPG